MAKRSCRHCLLSQGLSDVKDCPAGILELVNAGHSFEWAEIEQDLKALTETVIEEDGKRLAVRGKVFQSVGVAIPPAIREI